MDESESKAEQPKKERRLDPELLKKGLRCDLDQYERLKRCSKRKNMTEWNEWRRDHNEEDVLLEGAVLSPMYLADADFNRRALRDGKTNDVIRINSQVYLRDAYLVDAILEGACLSYAHLENVRFNRAHMKGANLRGAHLEGANFNDAYLKDARFNFADLHNSKFIDANVEGAIFYKAHLQGANFRTVLTNGATSFWESKVNADTDFRGVSLGNLRIHPRTKQLLEYAIRRRHWMRWYRWKDWHKDEPEEKRCGLSQSIRLPLHLFWSLSDYGRSTGRIAGWFFLLASAFAVIYANCEWLCSGGIVSNLGVEPHMPLLHYGVLLVVRPFYFSVVTMTTLGFGDMYANPESIWGHILLTLQVILGYVLMGALVTRFAVLFTAGGPAGVFADEEEENSR